MAVGISLLNYELNLERKRDYIIPGRIDLQVEILPVLFEKLSGMADGEPSAAIRERVIRAREIQASRYKGETHVHCNAQMNTRLMKQNCALDDECQRILKHAMTKYDMSARAYDRILKVARTIADLAGSEAIRPDHIRDREAA